MTSETFWARKRQELQQQGKLPQQRPATSYGGGAWWSETQSGSNPEQVMQQEQEHEPKHDFSKAMHLKSNDGNCPNCNSGDYVKPSASAAARCFQCGYIQGRDVNDLNTFAAVADVQTVKVRQTASAQGVRMGKSLAEINATNAALEKSAQGKARIDN